MSLGYFEIMADINDNTQEQTNQSPAVELIEDKYAPHYTDATITDKLDIFNAHDPILAGVNLKLQKPEPLDFETVRVGQLYEKNFNIRFEGCKNPVAVSCDVEGVEITPSILTPEQLQEGVDINVKLTPTEAYFLFGFIDGSIGFNGELSGVRVDLKAIVTEGKKHPTVKFNHDIWSIALNATGEYQFPVLILPEGLNFDIEIEVSEVAYYSDGVLHPVSAGRTKIIATTEETDDYYSAQAEFTLVVIDPEEVAENAYSLIPGNVDVTNPAAFINPNAAKPAEESPLETESISEPTLQNLVYPLEWEVVENDQLISPVITDENGFEMGAAYDENTPIIIYKGKQYRVLNTSLGKGTYTIKFL
jgi:hypothetical protein